MTRAIPLTVLLAALSVQGADAQDSAAPFRWIPQDAVLVARWDGPARWSERFAGTLAQPILLQPGVQAALRRSLAPIEQWRSQLLFRTDLDTAPLVARLAAHRGRVTLAVTLDPKRWVDAISRGFAPDDPPPVLAQLVLEPDGTTDLGAIARAVREIVQACGGDVGARTFEAAGRTLTIVSGATLPELIDGRLVVFAGTRLEEQVRACSQETTETARTACSRRS